MPSSIIGAIVASVVASGVSGAVIAGVAIGALGASIIGGLAGAIVTGVVSKALHGSSGDQGSPSITQQGRMLTVRQPAAAWQVIYGERRVGGTFTHIEVSADNQYLHLVITLAGHVCNQIGDIYFDDEVVPLDGNGEATGRFAGYVRIKKSLGDEGDVQPFSDLQAESAGKWTSAHKQRGRTKIYVRLKANEDLFPGGTPNITAVIQGKKVYDPRTTLTAYSTNVALCVADYLTDTTFGLGATYATEIDETTLIAAANLCDEDVNLAAGGTEDRYRLGGAFEVSTQPREVMGRMLAALAGWAVNVGGKWYLYGGAYEAPTITLDEGDLAGPIRVQSLVSRRENANAVKGVFTDPNSHWQVTDFPALASSTYLTEDGGGAGDRAWKDLDLSAFVTSGTQAQRLAKIELLSLRQGLSCVGQFKLTAYQAVTGRTVALTNAKFGWSAKAFQVQSSRFTVNPDGTLGVELGLRETAAAVWDWTSSEEQTIDIAPNTNLPDPSAVETPSGLSVNSDDSELIVAGDGTVISRMKVTWTVTDYNVIAGGRVLCQYKRATDSDYTDAAPVPGNATQLYITAVEDGVLYDVRVRFENVIGVKGAYASTQHTVVGKTERPEDVPWFSINGQVLTWGEVSDVDLAGYRLRYLPGINFNWGAGVPLHNGLVPAPPFETSIVTGGQVTLLIKAVDTTGNESENVAYIVTNFGDAIVANVVETFDLDALSYPGEVIQGALDAGDLKANDASDLMWNENADSLMWAFDTSLMWRTQLWHAMYYIAQITPRSAGVGSGMTIDHTIVADNYAIEYRRNGPGLMWKTVDTELMWSSDTADFWSLPPGDFPRNMWSGDSNLLWATDSSKLMWQVVEGGYQTWPGHVEVLVNEPYDIRVTTGFGTTRGVISTLTVTIDMPDLFETFDDVTINAAGTRLSITNAYREISNVSVTVQDDGGTAISAKVMDKNPTLGPRILCLDAAGAAVNGRIDASIQGF